MTDLPAQQGNLLNTNFIRLDVEKVRGYYATRSRRRGGNTNQLKPYFVQSHGITALSILPNQL